MWVQKIVAGRRGDELAAPTHQVGSRGKRSLLPAAYVTTMFPTSTNSSPVMEFLCFLEERWYTMLLHSCTSPYCKQHESYGRGRATELPCLLLPLGSLRSVLSVSELLTAHIPSLHFVPLTTEVENGEEVGKEEGKKDSNRECKAGPHSIGVSKRRSVQSPFGQPGRDAHFHVQYRTSQPKVIIHMGNVCAPHRGGVRISKTNFLIF